MVSRSLRRAVLSFLAVALLWLPVAAQAAPRAHAATAVDRIAEPAQWLTRLWEAVTGLWQTATTEEPTNGAGQGNPDGSGMNDAGVLIDPDGNH